MAEIRSTIDIMMERTKGMALSVQEKERLKNEELQKKAKGYALRLMDLSGPNQAVLTNLMEETPEDRPVLDKLIWNEVVGGVSNEAELSVFLDRFESWPLASSKKSEIEQFKITFKDQSKNKNKDKKVVLEREKKKLADAGISGSAVVPKFSKNMESALMAELIQEFKKTLL
ncbi:MAG: hypothetical protein P4L38_11425 [Syntrophaceae bacterium]|nr:hypothetical protein [Syntrophaceae bacterium]